jgi:hypothetical protein
LSSVLLLLSIDTREIMPSRRGLASGTAVGLVLMAIPPLARTADLAPLTPTTLVLAAVGAVGALGCATAARSVVRAVPAEQT